LCSPTRSCFLTGRNHHQNSFATISEAAVGYPGYSSHIPEACAPMAKVLRRAGWSTFWVGKNHNVPVDEWTMGASKERWPLGMGYDRFYGFIGGETNNWYPDLADKALEFIRDSKQTEPDKPWYLWFCPGANHAPAEYIAKYKGRFDDGYEAYREWVLPRMIERGILPEGTELTAINPMADGTFSPADAVRPWGSLSDEERRLFSRMAEVYAGFSEYTDAQVGRIVDYLEESGQPDNTIIFYAADNGASGEGSPNGSVNESTFANGYPDSVEENLALIDQLGTPATYNHYPTGWAVAFSAPYRMFKRYSYHSFDADGPTRKQTQLLRDAGHPRHLAPGLEGGRRARALHRPRQLRERPLAAVPHRRGPCRAHDLVERHPEKLQELTGLWLEEARKNNVLPSTTSGCSACRRSSSRCRCHPRASTCTTRTPARSPSTRPPTPTASRSRCSPRSSSPPRPRA
jgi:hypothetical protein